MRKRLKVIAITFLTYFLSFFLFGKSSFGNRIISENNSTYKEFKWTENISIISNVKFKELRKIAEIIFENNEKTDIHYIENERELTDKIKKIKNYKYILFFEKFTPFVILSESENIEEYAATWNRKYIWCFWKWIMISNTMESTS